MMFSQNPDSDSNRIGFLFVILAFYNDVSYPGVTIRLLDGLKLRGLCPSVDPGQAKIESSSLIM
jgi:hypothetical protein